MFACFGLFASHFCLCTANISLVLLTSVVTAFPLSMTVTTDTRSIHVLVLSSGLNEGSHNSLDFANAVTASFVSEPALYKVSNKFGRVQQYSGAVKSLARPGRKQATAIEDFDVHISFFFSPGATTPMGCCILQPSSGL